MFDDDIEHVRLQAMRVLGKIAQGRVLRGEQVLSILTELLVRKYRMKFKLFCLLLFRVVRMIFVQHFMMFYELYVLAIQRHCLNYFIVLWKIFKDSKPILILY